MFMKLAARGWLLIHSWILSRSSETNRCKTVKSMTTYIGKWKVGHAHIINNQRVPWFLVQCFLSCSTRKGIYAWSNKFI